MTEEKRISPQEFFVEVQGIIASRADSIGANYLSLRDAIRTPFFGTGVPQLDPLRIEAATCLLFGLNQAAITMTNHLLESFMKYCLTYRLSHPAKSHDAAGTPSEQIAALIAANDRVDDMDLAVTIKMAARMGIVSKEDKGTLLELKEEFRNPYSHASKKKLFKGRKITMYSATTTAEGNFSSPEPFESPVATNPIVSCWAQLEHAKSQAMPYFLYLDHLIRCTLPGLYGRQAP